MDRIFQHNEGEVTELNGATFTTVKALIDDKDNNVYLLWLFDKTSKYWYRIFIDGIYCGVDQYLQDGSMNDEDDDISWQDHSNWFKGKSLSCAEVSFAGKVGDDIVLSMFFEDSEFRLICKFEAGSCRLEFA
ncbi:hypothetical protein [Zooshikella harenae]|uniref:DUF4178 domain-containing protein n=1 Tax=Zooshikella harenae TaxID=2827238 RepID=A0ABS5ZGK5_9GAMM|nr:hypothetical protein [Zooshikella harenae]MBU2713186.1 hypothetical protein [Zooshikella harenae]